MSLEEYIKNLDPELQEKARACGSVQELLALAKEAGIPVPDEALAAIAGGDDTDDGGCLPDVKCPRCGSTNTVMLIGGRYWLCEDCGYEWCMK